jgi:hypothetical protein
MFKRPPDMSLTSLAKFSGAIPNLGKFFGHEVTNRHSMAEEVSTIG